MALEIKSTPTLKGKSAQRFISLIKNNEGNRISFDKRQELDKLAQTILSKAKI